MNYFVIIQFGFSFGTALALAAIHVSTIAIGQEVSYFVKKRISIQLII